VIVLTDAIKSVLTCCLLATATVPAGAQQEADCPVTHDQLRAALKRSLKASGGPANGGFENHSWASVVARDGTVCAVAYSGDEIGAQWPGSRAVAAAKANTANAFSLPGAALSTANLYASSIPGGSLFGLSDTSPVRSDIIHSGDTGQFGTPNDPMIGKLIGGVVVFGGGLALYSETGIVGGLGVSGDSSCADHNAAWRVRAALGLNHVPAGVNPKRKDAIVYDLNNYYKSASGFGHPLCLGTEADVGNGIGASVGGEKLQ
jgi:uncharacterized protein GlcG (DUF336 family)